MLNEGFNQSIVYSGGNIMPRGKVNELLEHFSGKVSGEQLAALRSKFSRSAEDSYEDLLRLKMKNPTTVLLFAIFLGGLGVDCFVLGKIGKGIAKIFFNVATFGIWGLIDIFTAFKQTKEYNFNTISAWC